MWVAAYRINAAPLPPLFERVSAPDAGGFRVGSDRWFNCEF